MVEWTSTSNFTTTSTTATRDASGSGTYAAYAQTDPITSGVVYIEGKFNSYGSDKNDLLGLGTQSGGTADMFGDPFFCVYQTGSTGTLWAVNIDGSNIENDQSMSDGDLFKLEYNFATGTFTLYQNGTQVTQRTGYSQTSLSGVVGGKITGAGAYDIAFTTPSTSSGLLLPPPYSEVVF